MSMKEEVYKECCEMVIEKIQVIEAAMAQAQESANSEEKSTAGDKHDTARAMSHIERDMYARQLSEALKLKQTLDSIDINLNRNEVEAGSLVVTDQANYFLAVALGKIMLEDKTEVFAISPMSPIGQKFLGKMGGAVINFNGRSITVHEVL